VKSELPEKLSILMMAETISAAFMDTVHFAFSSRESVANLACRLQ